MPYKKITNLLFASLLSLAMCENPIVKKDQTVLPPGIKTYPPIDSAVMINFLPIFSTWDLACGSCNPLDTISNYNGLCPTYKGKNSICGKAQAGCVAVAMATVMHYFKQPGTYDWTAMKDSCSTREMARLMHDAGVSVNMIYDVRGSSTTPGDGESGIPSISVVPKALLKSFGYRTATHGKFSLDTLIREIDSGRPVIVSACRNVEGFDIFCHAWVINGYAIDQKNKYHLFMNWGLGFSNWSKADAWKPKGYDLIFSSKQEMIYNIK
ncbi:MAG: hypothetical protein HOP30_04780 [Cyclobacteriaceae bacterium]|nr:hypothetical protein [Cyclobacteriaceae bacterium]